MATKKQKLSGGKEEMQSLVAKKREELRSLRFSSAGSKNRNVKLSRTLRKEIARALTAINSVDKLGTSSAK
jgi:ribosomal protein L29